MTGGITLWKDRGYEVDVPKTLTAEQRERYSRHMLIPEIGESGQQKLLDAKVLLLGAGGLGSPTALYLAAAGVGTLGIVDNDVVDLSNLQRQVIHNTERASACPRSTRPRRRSTPSTRTSSVVKYKTRLDASNIMEIIAGYDIIVDGVDNFPTRYLLNDASRAPADPGRVGVDPRLRRAAVGLQALRGALLPLPVPGAAAGRARAVLRRQRRARRAAGDDGPAAGDRGHQADRRRRRARDRPAAALRRARGDARPRSRSAATPMPDLLARSGLDHATKRWACSPTTRRSAPRPGRFPPRWRRSRSHRSCAPRSAASARSAPTATTSRAVLASLIAAHPATAVAAVRRRRAAQPLRQRLSQRRRRARARRARHGGRSTATCS